MQLAAAISSAVASCGIELEKRKFRPHVTLGRANKGLIGVRHNKMVSDTFHIDVNEIKLFKSERLAGGSVYTEVAGYGLNDTQKTRLYDE